jgi:hypothetical protein
MCISKTCVAHPLAYFQSFGPDRLPSNLSGCISTAPFDHGYSIVLDLTHKRLGVYKGSIVALAAALPANIPKIYIF